jgi:transposase-like protein
MKQTLRKKKCKNPNCRKDFMGTNAQLYCCHACRSTEQNKLKKPKCKKKRASTLDEVAREARQLGMSYGQYVAMQYKAERM